MTYDFTDLRLFLQVVDAGSITHGAQRAHLALATASARITSMERTLGARLLVRHRRGVTPSPAGWVLVSHARQVLAELARMDAELTPFADGMPSAVVVLANTSATDTFAPAAATEFLKHHPEIDIVVKELPSQQIVESVTNAHAELGLIGDTVDVGLSRTLPGRLATAGVAEVALDEVEEKWALRRRAPAARGPAAPAKTRPAPV